MAQKRRRRSSSARPVRRARTSARRKSTVRRTARRGRASSPRRSAARSGGHRTLRIVIEQAPANEAARPETAVAAARHVRVAKF